MVLKNKTKKPNDYAKKNGNKLDIAPFLHFVRLIRHQTSFFRTWHGAWSLSSLANIPPMDKCLAIGHDDYSHKNALELVSELVPKRIG